MTSNHSVSDSIEAGEFESDVNLLMTSLQSAIGSFPSDDFMMILSIDFGELEK